MNVSQNGRTDYRAAPPIAPADQSRSGSHAHSVQFYNHDTFLIDELGRFIGSALGAGDVGIVVATKSHRDKLAKRLKALGVDVALAARQDRYVSLDADETLSKLMLDGWPDADRFNALISDVIVRATAAGNSEQPRVAVFGEMVALLWAEGKIEAAIRLEQLWNDLLQSYSFDLRCAYPMRYFSRTEDGETIRKVCATHSQVIPAESYTSLNDDEARLQAITLLQQKAQALEAEIEERKKVEQALHERNRELREAIVVRDEFLSIAAHELRTPITGLRCFVQLLLRDIQRKREVAPERLESALSVIELQTGKLTRLVARLLDTAQIEAGKLRVEPVKTDLAALVRSVLAQNISGTRHTFVFDGPDHIEALVDPARFEQVITNLLDNAVKFSPEGGIVTVTLGNGDGPSPNPQAPQGIRLCVTDQGVGIPPDQREAIFDRFYQAHNEHNLSGMGLGLYVTREIVELHGGSVWVEEPEHRDSRFVIALPPLAGDN